MLDPRTYRVAFVPLVIAILIAAFSLQPRPRPVGTTLAPDAFDGTATFQLLQDYAGAFPSRRPGSAGDDGLAARVATDLAVLGPGAVRTVRHQGQTIDGEQSLADVVATRIGRPGPGLVVVAHRDAAGSPAQAELSGTAVLVSLARAAVTGRFDRTITFVSTSGGSGGLAGARQAAREVAGPTDAVLVLGDLASTNLKKPWIVGFSDGRGAAPLRLRRTVEAAVRAETGQEAGGPRLTEQWARLAFPLTVSEQGAFGRAGKAAVLLSGTGERPPTAGASVLPERLDAFGRSALRSLYALDKGPDVPAGPRAEVVTLRKVLPTWAIALVVGAALLPLWVVAGGGVLRARRAGLRLRGGLGWAFGAVLPFLALGAFALVLGLAGLVPERPAAPVPPGVLAPDGTAWGVMAAMALVLVLGYVALRPLTLSAFDARAKAALGTPDGDAQALGTVVLLAFGTLVCFVVNPFAAALLIPAAHLWLLAVVPEFRVPRALGVTAVVLGALPVMAAFVGLLASVGYGLDDGLWAVALMLIGGHVGPLALLVLCLVAGAGVAAGLRAGGTPREEPLPSAQAPLRGPTGYAGPGSLGGTGSALRS